MKSWEIFLKEAEDKQKSKSRLEKEAEKILRQTQKEVKKEKEKKKKEKGSAHTRYLAKQLKFKQEKYEEQKKRQKEKAKEKAEKEPLEAAKKSLSSIRTEKIAAKDTTTTATKKAIGNVASLAGGVLGAAFHGARSIAAKKKAEKETEGKQPEARERKSPGRPKIERKLKNETKPSESKEGTKQIGGTPERKRLVPSTKRLPPASKKLSPSGGTPYQVSPEPSRETGMSLGKRARRNPALKSKLIKDRMEEYSNWREEFIFEVDDKSDNETKKKKIVNVMRGKNEIEINPKLQEDHKEIESGKKMDDEGYMARVELESMERAIKSLRKKIKKSDMQIPAWVQSKITRAADYIDTASEYMQSDEKLSEEIYEAMDKSKMKCNKPKAQAHGSGETGKSHVVKACEGNKEKLIRFGQLGVKGSPKKEGESKAYASRRHRFKARHAKNIAKGKMSAAYWSSVTKW